MFFIYYVLERNEFVKHFAAEKEDISGNCHLLKKNSALKNNTQVADDFLLKKGVLLMSRILNEKQKKKLSDPNVSGCVQNKRTYTTSTTLLIRSGISNSNGAQMSESRQTEACSLAHRIFCE